MQLNAHFHFSSPLASPMALLIVRAGKLKVSLQRGLDRLEGSPPEIHPHEIQ